MGHFFLTQSLNSFGFWGFETSSTHSGGEVDVNGLCCQVSFSEVRKFLLAAVFGTTLAVSLAVIIGFALENAVQKDRYLWALCPDLSSWTLIGAK
eukprot:2984906-Amphidinium_carterae.1